MYKKMIFSTLSSYFASIFAFATTMLIAKSTTIELFGMIAFAIAIGSFFQIIINFASDKTFVKDIVENANIKSFNYLIIQSLFQIMLLFILLSIYYIFFNTNTLVLYVSIWITLIGLYPKGAYDHNEKVFIHTILILIERAISFIVILSFVYLNEFTINKPEEIFLILIFIRSISILSQVFFLYNKKDSNDYRYNIKSFYKNLSKRTLVILALLSNAIMIYGLQIIMKHKLNYQSVAIYGIAIQLTLLVIIAQGQLTRYLNKKIFTQTKNKKIDLISFKKLLKVSTIFSFPLSMLMIGIAYVLETFFLKNGYSNLTYISAILAIWLNILGPGAIISQYFLSIFGEKKYLQLSLFASLLALFLALFLFKYLNIYAAPIILLISHSSIIVQQYKLLIQGTLNVE